MAVTDVVLEAGGRAGGRGTMCRERAATVAKEGSVACTTTQFHVVRNIPTPLRVESAD